MNKVYIRSKDKDLEIEFCFVFILKPNLVKTVFRGYLRTSIIVYTGGGGRRRDEELLRYQMRDARLFVIISYMV